MLKALLLERFLRHDEILIAEALLFLGERKIITVLRVSVYGLFIRANLPILPIVLFRVLLDGVFLVFGIVRSVVFSRDGIVVFAVALFRAASSAFLLYLGRFIFYWIFLIITVTLLGCIQHVHVI